MQPSLFPWGEIKNKKPFFWRVFCWSFQTGWVSLGDRNSWQGKSPLVPHLSGKPADRDFPWCSLFLLYWPGYSSVFREVLSYTGKRKNSSLVRVNWKMKNIKARGFPENYRHFWCVKVIKNSVSGTGVKAVQLVFIPFDSFKSLPLPYIFSYDAEKNNSENYSRKGLFSLSVLVFFTLKLLTMFTSMESEIQIIFPFNSLQWLESLGKKKMEKKRGVWQLSTNWRTPSLIAHRAYTLC